MIVWTIRIAVVLYVIALARMIRRRPARAWWAAGCVFYLAHVVAAFHFAFNWNHAAAVQETARQTKVLFGLNWDGGIWFNHAFTVIWTADAIWWLMAPLNRRCRPVWIGIAVHSFMAFMFINGAIVVPLLA